LDRRPRTGQTEQTGQRQSGAATRLELSGSIPPWRVTRALAVVVASLVLLSVACQLARRLLPDFPGRDLVASVFDLDGEWNVPALYSTLSILVCAALLWLIARAEQFGGSRPARQWRLLSLLFVGLALDELLGFHETLNGHLQLGAVSRFTRFSWVAVGAVFAVAVALALSGFLARLPAATRRGFLIAGAIFLTGALGVEAVGGHLSRTLGQDSLVYLATADVEETLEMVGIVVFLQALLAHLRRVASAVVLELRVDDERPAP
jgi:hypothetical protein